MILFLSYGSDIMAFIIFKVMKYRKILIKYNAYFKKAVKISKVVFSLQ